MQYRGTYLEVDLGAIARNTAVLRQSIQPISHMMAIVKADAYGHGSVAVANTALQNGADWLGVAIPEEGQKLREAGITAPILVLGLVNQAGAAASVRFNLTQAVCDELRVQWLEEAAAAQQKTALVHLKCDTGMGRIGVRTKEELLRVLQKIESCPHVRLTGAFMHFADADGKDNVYSNKQLATYREMIALLPKDLIIHAAASSAGSRYPEARFDMVRQGISLYGCPQVPETPPIEPAMSWHTEIVYLKTLPAGESVSYGCTYTTKRETVVATLPVGYGDGYHRAMSGKAQVLVNGQRCPVIGRICMDQIMVDVTDVPAEQVYIGAPVVLMGRQGAAEITAEEMGAWAGTISYEVMLAVTARVPVHYQLAEA